MLNFYNGKMPENRSDRATARTTGRISMVEGSNDVFRPKHVPFRGLDEKFHNLGALAPKTLKFGAQYRISHTLWAARNENCYKIWTNGPITMKFSGCMQINKPETLQCTKSAVESEIHDGGVGHIGLFKMRLLSQILTDFDKIWWSMLRIQRAIRKS